MLTFSLIWLLHLLPEPIIFFMSDFLYLLMYHLVRYRRKVVYGNLEKAFPEMSEKERVRTAKKFYHHLCDTILESALFPFYSEKKARRRMQYKNPEVLTDLQKQGKQIMAVLGHYGNWEYLATLGLETDHPVVAIYKPLKNKYFNQRVLDDRSAYGVVPVPMEKIARKLIEFHRDKIPAITLFLGDQRPVFRQIQYWTKFMGINSPMYLGTEKLAHKLDAAVVFLKIRKVKRGRYETEVELICESPADMKPYEITDRHVKILENLIREEPAYWLWSHNRWKHSYERFKEVRGEK